MKKIILFTLFFMMASVCQAQTYLWRYRSDSACTGLTDGKTRDLCHDTTDDVLYKCVPSAGDCDTAVEWKQVSATDLTDLDNFNSSTVTSGNFLMADGSNWHSVTISGDGTVAWNGVLTITDDSHAHIITDVDAFTETQLETQLSDVTNVFTNNDGALANDDLSDDTLDALSNVNASTNTNGNIFVSDDNGWNVLTLGTNTHVLTADSTTTFGVKWAAPSSSVTELTDLSDVNTATITHGNMFFANGTNWNATDKIQMKSGQLILKDYDCSGNSNSGALTADTNGIVSCSDDDGGAGGGDNVTVNSTAADTTANLLDGDIDFTLVDGGAGGPDDITATVGCTECVAVGEIDFIDSATATSGNILMGDGDSFHSVTVGSDIVFTWNGTATVQSDSIALTTDTTGNYVTSITNGTGITGGDGGSEGAALTLSYNGDLDGNSDVNTATQSKGGILYSDGTQFHLLAVGTNDQLLTADSAQAPGIKWAGGGSGATELTGLADVNSSTATIGNLLVATNGDGFISSNNIPANIVIGGTITAGSGQIGITNSTGFIDGDVINADSIDSGEIQDNSLTANDLASSSVEVSELADWNSVTSTRGNIFAADGTSFHVITVGSNDQVLTADSAQPFGVKWAAGGGGDTQLVDLNDVNSATATFGNLLVADGAAFISRDLDLAENWSWAAGDTIASQPNAAEFDGIAPISKDDGTNLEIFSASFDDTADECRGVHFKVPKNVNEDGDCEFHASWYSKTATTGNVQWYFTEYDYNNNASWDTATSDIDANTEPLAGAVDQIKTTTWTSTLSTLTWSFDDNIIGWVCRDGDADKGTDSLTGDAEMTNFAIECDILGTQ